MVHWANMIGLGSGVGLGLAPVRIVSYTAGTLNHSNSVKYYGGKPHALGVSSISLVHRVGQPLPGTSDTR